MKKATRLLADVYEAKGDVVSAAAYDELFELWLTTKPILMHRGSRSLSRINYFEKGAVNFTALFCLRIFKQ